MSITIEQFNEIVARRDDEEQRLDADIALAEARNRELLLERDSFFAAQLADIESAKRTLEEREAHLAALLHDPFRDSAPPGDFDDWRHWARDHLQGLDLQDMSAGLLLMVTDSYGNASADTKVLITRDSEADPSDFGAIGAVVLSDEVHGIDVSPHGLACAPDHLFTALCTLCADAPSSVSHIFGDASVIDKMHSLKAAEEELAAMVAH